MSRYTYAGSYQNPTTDWIVKPVRGGFGIFVRATERRADGSMAKDRRHTSRKTFKEEEDAHAWIESTHDFFEDDYDQYLEENHDSIVQMERYESFMNER